MKKILLVFITIFLSNIYYAQNVDPKTLNICGGFANTGYYQFEWSVGDMAVTETFTYANGALTNGVLQPLTDKPNITPLLSNTWDVSEIKIFPSPTTGRFELNVISKNQGLLEIQLLDNMGQVLYAKSSYYYGFGLIEKFDISRNASANYYLRVTLSANVGFNSKKGSFKILKIN
jgi:hypothetical protein